MDILTTILIALGLAMDAFAVSVTSGFSIERCGMRHALILGGFFGVFQALMPIAGWLAGMGVKGPLMAYDHWVAFGLLASIGGKMVYEATVIGEAERKCLILTLPVLLTLSIATSIDALAVGVTFAFLGVTILMPVVIIGLVTFAVSYVGVYIGKHLGALFGKKLEVLGGVILIGMGVKILIDHLFFGG